MPKPSTCCAIAVAATGTYCSYHAAAAWGSDWATTAWNAVAAAFAAVLAIAILVWHR
jgi:hypothetical protein